VAERTNMKVIDGAPACPGLDESHGLWPSDRKRNRDKGAVTPNPLTGQQQGEQTSRCDGADAA
jgi:hypothetical protein